VRGAGGSGTEGSEVGSLVEDEVRRIAEKDASEPGDRGNRAADSGIGLVCVDAAATLSRLQSRADCLQIFDVVVADG